MTPWVGNLISSSQTKASLASYQNILNHKLTTYMKVKKTNQRIGEKTWGQRPKR
jgi:hypothetical protein